MAQRNRLEIRIISFALLAVFSLSSMACGERAVATKVPDSDEGVPVNLGVLTKDQTGWTSAIPSGFLSTAKQQGAITRIVYDSKDYAGDGRTIKKIAFVYTPFGYNENDSETRYDIIYLMHGWGGYAGEHFEQAGMRNLFDNMIEKKLMKPAIIVSATFYNENSGTDFGSSVSELRSFHKDFVDNLMPTIESEFHTYAKSTTADGLMSSRDHRAFGGFSLGAVTTWLEFCHNYDYIKYFLPMSGSSWYYGGYGDFQIQKNVDFVEEIVKENNLERRGYFIYHAVGTNDAVKSQTEMMAKELLNRKNVFTKEHYMFYRKDGGYHDLDAVAEYLYNALPLFFDTDDFTQETKIEDVKNDAAFGGANGYGKLIFPVESSYYSGETLKDLSLTWYNYIDPNKTVEIVNYMKSHALNGHKIFFDIYTDDEKRNDPEKKNTGLFFFKGNPGAKFAIVNAGGGFAYVGAMHDSFPHALELSKKGYNAFALIYRPGAETACEDLARAIAFIFEHADELEIDTNGYSLWGGSAGGRMAAWLGSYGTETFGERKFQRPAAVIVNYTGLSEVTGLEPPTFSAVGKNDWIANWKTMKARLDSISKLGIATEFVAFEGLSHGFGLGTGTVAEGWLDKAVKFWEFVDNR